MSVTIELTFPAGRYHATPWGRHVNEGVVEWPPSPWRLLRALVAVWKRTCPEITQQPVRRILEQLSPPPQFHLPSHRTAHTRHYMPLNTKGARDLRGGGTTLVFDTFVSVARNSPAYIGWPDANLDAEESTILGRLLQNLSSLGRAESWAHAKLIDIVPDWNCRQASDDEADPVAVFCPDPATVLGDEHYPTLDPKKLAQGKLNSSAFLFDCPRWHLCLDTETIHAERWPTAPGARWVNYTRPSEQSNRSSAHSSPSRRTKRPLPTVARLLLDGPVLPLATDTVRVAEAFRRAAMSRFASWCERHSEDATAFRRLDKPNQYSSPILAGKELNGDIRKDHRHAYYLPTVEGDDPRRITHVTVVSDAGFGPGEVAAFMSLRKLTLNDKSMKVRVQLVGLGRPDDFKAQILQESTEWESVTPFVVHRHFKQRGAKRDQLDPSFDDPRPAFVQLAARELIERVYGASPIVIELIAEKSGSALAIDFRRYRDYRREDARGRWFGFLRIRFSQPIVGPLAIGYGSHFGLGLFSSPAV